jgi:RNA polymerase sigma-70 factor (ECF subfamily)
VFSSEALSRSHRSEPIESGEERKFLDRLKTGDRDAFNVLVADYSEMVFNLALRMVRARELAEDLTQEVFVKVFKGLPGFRGRSSLSTWIYRIAYNTAVSEMEKVRYRYETTDLDDLDSTVKSDTAFAESSGDFLDAIDRSETVQKLNHLIEELKPEQKWAMTLYYMGDKTYEEISEIMGAPMGTVKTLLFRAKSELRRRLRDMEKK